MKAEGAQWRPARRSPSRTPRPSWRDRLARAAGEALGAGVRARGLDDGDEQVGAAGLRPGWRCDLDGVDVEPSLLAGALVVDSA